MQSDIEEQVFIDALLNINTLSIHLLDILTNRENYEK